jgi:ribosomal protein S18 acetylase RimI-like enzyme
MSKQSISEEPIVRPMRKEDFEAVVEIDARVFNERRPEYYERKMAQALDESRQLVTSLVLEVKGRVVGFIMGEVYLGEFGVPETTATVDTLGLDPEYQGYGIGKILFGEFVTHLRELGIQVLSTQVRWNDWDLLGFFEKMGFTPAKVVHLEMAL